MNNDNIYWLFSAAAQSIAAFVAFLLTGYALVHSLMEAAREKDDELEEIHVALRKKYYKRLTRLAWVTGLAIVLSLVTVFVNRWEFSYKPLLMVLTSVIDFVAVVGGLAFVVSIVNPSKYERTAARVLKERRIELNLSDRLTSSAAFFEEFRHLERIIRDYLRRNELYVPSRGAPRMSFSFRQMIDALIQNERIDAGFHDELIKINKYRNLVFHGHLEQADQAMVERVRAAALQMKQLE
ncbi:MAG: hypothetical protein WAV28_19730 [Sedimentisphaerales bacterium]